MLKNIIKSILFIYFTSCAYAQDDQYVVDAGLGVFGTKGYSLSQVKFAKVGLQEDLWNNFKQRFNAGGWLDNKGNNYSNSGFGGYQLGFEVSNDVFESSAWTGPTLITNTDSELGGYVQFNESLFFGIKDSRDSVIGIAYNHFSSAGLETPNQGKDFMCLEIKFPF